MSTRENSWKTEPEVELNDCQFAQRYFFLSNSYKVSVSAHLSFCQLGSLENKANEVRIIYLPLARKEITLGMTCLSPGGIGYLQLSSSQGKVSRHPHPSLCRPLAWLVGGVFGFGFLSLNKATPIITTRFQGKKKNSLEQVFSILALPTFLAG